MPRLGVRKASAGKTLTHQRSWSLLEEPWNGGRVWAWKPAVEVALGASAIPTAIQQGNAQSQEEKMELLEAQEKGIKSERGPALEKPNPQ